MTENRITVPKDIYTLKSLKVIITKFELFSISYSQVYGSFPKLTFMFREFYRFRCLSK